MSQSVSTWACVHTKSTPEAYKRKKWAQPYEKLCFTSFHSSLLQFYLWKVTRNVLCCQFLLLKRASQIHRLKPFFSSQSQIVDLDYCIFIVLCCLACPSPLAVLQGYNRSRTWRLFSIYSDFLLSSSLVQLSWNATL